MRATDFAIRRCIDQFADDLIDIAEEQIREQVAVALSRIKTPPARAVTAKRGKAAAKPQKSVKPPKSKKEAKPKREKLSALEKLERAQARRQERAEAKKRERQLALPFSGKEDAAGEAAVEPSEPKRRGRRGAVSEGAEAPRAKSQRAPAPQAPPPLFVVKRTRDGSIQALQRKAAEEAAAAAQQAEAQGLPPN